MSFSHVRLLGLGLLLLTASAACSRKEPPPPTAEKKGAAIYARICTVCHGAAGEGYKADQAPALRNPEYLASASDGLLRESILNGRRGSTMSAWGRQSGGPLTDADADAVVAFLRTWQTKDAVVMDEKPLTGDAGRGSALYHQECLKCHGARGTEGPNARLRDPGFLANASNGFLRLAIRNGRAGTLMLPFAAKLGDQGVEDLVAFMRSWTPLAVTPPPPPPPDAPPLPLGKIPLNPKGPAPIGFRATPEFTPADVVKAQLSLAPTLVDPGDASGRYVLGQLGTPKYLRQVREWGGPGVDDVAQAYELSGHAAWRMHAHLAAHAAPPDPLSATTGVLDDCLTRLVGGGHPLTHHLESEVYVWPRATRTQQALAKRIAKELTWLRDRLTALGLDEV